jgi:LacI family transcriptional regulator
VDAPPVNQQRVDGNGLTVPRDVSVVGFEDHEFVADFADPPLTTVALPHYEMGEWAVSALVDRINGAADEPRLRLVPCRLVRHASVAPPATKATDR